MQISANVPASLKTLHAVQFVSLPSNLTSLTQRNRIPPEVIPSTKHRHDQSPVSENAVRARGQSCHNLTPFVLEERGLKRHFQQTSLVIVVRGTDNQEKDEKQSQNDKTRLGMEKTMKDKAKSKPESQ
ncbi:hypothetical protein Tco_0621119 [Tanacetum coccineum]